MNKKRFTFLAALLIAISIFGQLPEKTSILEGNNQKMAPAPAAPEQISYQAVVRDDNNATVANQVVGMQISVLQTTANGTAVYVETQTPTTNANGLLSIYIGAGSAVTATFSVIDWSSGPYFIKIEIDPSGDNANYTITGTTQLVSVPFAMYAKTSGSSTPGPQGTNGTQGIQGATGTSGADGATGPSGTTGAQGIQGETGIAGATGSLGAQGDIGATGVAGTNGTDGAQGIQGATGTSGAPGVAGTNGTQGIQGEIGTTGADGAPGIPTEGTEGQVLKMVGGIPVWSDPVQFVTFYIDTDGDGYGNNDEQLIVLSGSTAPNGYASNNTDCNDTDATINPATVWFIGVDTDGDTFFGSTTSLTQCEFPGTGYVIAEPATLDCDDSLATGSSINPDVMEVLANGIDDNCDGQVDEVDVGQLRDGGIVFWVDPADNTKGKVCALEDVSNEDGQTLLNWADAISYSFGYTNSDTGTGVYGDWYLPSKDELRLMYTNLQRFGCSTNTPEGADSSLCPTRKGEFNNYYWSSTENGNYNAWFQYFSFGSQYNYNKISTFNVRAVRAF
jgi:hypothetical protein